MTRKIWEINTKNGFVNCIGYTKKQALEIIIQSMIIDEERKIQEKQKKKKLPHGEYESFCTGIRLT